MDAIRLDDCQASGRMPSNRILTSSISGLKNPARESFKSVQRVTSLACGVTLAKNASTSSGGLACKLISPFQQSACSQFGTVFCAGETHLLFGDLNKVSDKYRLVDVVAQHAADVICIAVILIACLRHTRYPDWVPEVVQHLSNGLAQGYLPWFKIACHSRSGSPITLHDETAAF